MSDKQHEQQKRESEQQKREGEQDPTKPGTKLANPAQPYAATEIPKRQDASAFLRKTRGEVHPDGYPKLKYHPVHGGVEVKDPGEESELVPHHDWFDTPELADAARTWTEAEQVRVKNQQDKLKELEESGLQVVRNSVQSDEAIRQAKIEPL